jgi:hypothetical protein
MHEFRIWGRIKGLGHWFRQWLNNRGWQIQLSHYECMVGHSAQDFGRPATRGLSAWAQVGVHAWILDSINIGMLNPPKRCHEMASDIFQEPRISHLIFHHSRWGLIEQNLVFNDGLIDFECINVTWNIENSVSVAGNKYFLYMSALTEFLASSSSKDTIVLSMTCRHYFTAGRRRNPAVKLRIWKTHVPIQNQAEDLSTILAR